MRPAWRASVADQFPAFVLDRWHVGAAVQVGEADGSPESDPTRSQTKDKASACCCCGCSGSGKLGAAVWV